MKRKREERMISYVFLIEESEAKCWFWTQRDEQWKWEKSLYFQILDSNELIQLGCFQIIYKLMQNIMNNIDYYSYWLLSRSRKEIFSLWHGSQWLWARILNTAHAVTKVKICLQLAVNASKDLIYDVKFVTNAFCIGETVLLRLLCIQTRKAGQIRVMTWSRMFVRYADDLFFSNVFQKVHSPLQKISAVMPTTTSISNL